MRVDEQNFGSFFVGFYDSNNQLCALSETQFRADVRRLICAEYEQLDLDVPGLVFSLKLVHL